MGLLKDYIAEGESVEYKHENGKLLRRSDKGAWKPHNRDITFKKSGAQTLHRRDHGQWKPLPKGHTYLHEESDVQLEEMTEVELDESTHKFPVGTRVYNKAEGKHGVVHEHGQGDKYKGDHGHLYVIKHADGSKTVERVHSLEKDVTKESVELAEISDATKTSYIEKAFNHGNDLHDKIKKTQDENEKKRLRDKVSQRNQGIIKAAKSMREELEALDEVAIGDLVKLHKPINGHKYGQVTGFKMDKSAKQHPGGKVSGKSTHAIVHTKASPLYKNDFGHKHDVPHGEYTHIKNSERPQEIYNHQTRRESVELDEQSLAHDYVQSSLAGKDIESEIKGGKVHVHRENLHKAVYHLKKIGYGGMKVTAGLKEETVTSLKEFIAGKVVAEEVTPRCGSHQVTEVQTDDVIEEAVPTYSEFTDKIKGFKNSGAEVTSSKHTASKAHITVKDSNGSRTYHYGHTATRVERH